MNLGGRLILASLVVGFCTQSVWADSVLQRAEPAARARFEALAERYKALPYYQDEGAFSRTILSGDSELAEKTPVLIRFSAPNLLVLQAGEIEILSDGKGLKTLLHPTKRFLEEASPSRLRFSRISDGPAGALLFGGFTGPPTQLLLRLLMGEPATSALPDRTSAIKLESARLWEGMTYDCLLLEQGDEPPMRVYIDQESNLIRRMEYLLDPAKLSEKVPGAVDLKSMTLAWNSGPILTKAPEVTAFNLKSPEGYQRIEPAKPKIPAQASAHPLLGKPAPEFQLELLDGPGKTRKATRGDLAGKIVILDFWATWCGPCLLELPEIRSLTEELERAKKTDVVIVAVSQDRQPDEGGSARKLVEDLLDAKQWKLAQGPISRVALDPDQTVGELFGVDALPTLVVIDAKGVVQAVHVGFKEDIKSTLLDQIDQLRAGKSLVEKSTEK